MPRQRHVAAAGALLALAVFAGVACTRDSNNDTKPRTTISLVEWTRAADKICASSSNALAGADTKVDPFDSDVTKAQLGDATDLIDAFAKQLDTSVADFNALDQPDEQQETAADFIVATKTASQEFAAAAAAAGRDGDLGEFKSRVKTGAHALDDATAAAKKLELEQCGGGSGATTTRTTPPTSGAAAVPGV